MPEGLSLAGLDHIPTVCQIERGDVLGADAKAARRRPGGPTVGLLRSTFKEPQVMDMLVQ